MKYLYMIFIVLSHFIFSIVYTVYALLLYCSLCEPLGMDTPEERWKIFNSSVSLSTFENCKKQNYRKHNFTISLKIQKQTLKNKKIYDYHLSILLTRICAMISGYEFCPFNNQLNFQYTFRILPNQ